MEAPSVLSKEELLKLKKKFIKNKNISLEELETVFPSIYTSLENANGVGDYRVICCDALSIWFLRATLVLSDPHLKKQLSDLITDEVSTFIFNYVLDFWNESGAPLGNSLREMFVKLVTFLIAVGDKSDLYRKWLLHVLENCPFTLRVLYFMVENLIAHIPGASKLILQDYSNFVTTSISYMWSNALANPVAKALRVVFKCHYNDLQDPHIWLTSWDQLIVENMKRDDLRKNIQNYLLPYLFKISPESFKEFVSNLILSKCADDLYTVLISLRIGHELAIIEDPFEIISIETLSELISSDKPFFRLEALSLITLSPRGSKPISQPVLELVLSSLDVYFIEMDLEMRNEFVSLFKKFVLRLRDSTYALNRTLVKLQAKNKFPEEVAYNLGRVELSRVFFEKLLLYLVLNMRPGVSFQRCNMAFKLLIILLRSGLDPSVDKRFYEKLHMDYPYSIEIYKDPKIVRLLIDSITNDFEELRELCITILSMSSISIQDLISQEQYALILSRSLEMLGDLKGRKADAGAKVLQFLFSNGDQKAYLLDRIVTSLQELVKVAQDNLTVAVYEANIHGYYLALKTILDGIKDKSELSYFVNHLKAIISTLFDVWTLTKPVLSHDSPEGNLPEELQNSVEPSRKHLETKYGPATQVILSYSWRSIKDSTALLASILLVFSDEELFSSSDFSLNDIGELIIDQLSTIRHPGAFSSVYPTFVSCCNRCFRLAHQDLPEQWLDKNIGLIQNKSHSITRRSGGLPFLITAVLTAEYNHIRKSKQQNKNEIPKLFESTFDKLLEIGSQPFNESSGEETLDLPQVHALNSIKSLFIESQLSDLSNFYVDKSLDLALSRFSSNHWSIRNAAVMLFTALQNRLFGTKKIDNNHLSTISARLFFSKYKKLHGVLLKNFANALLNEGEVENLFPVLTVLSRLHSTPGYNPVLEFKPLLLQSLGNKYWKVREMAARALPSIVDVDCFYDEIVDLAQNIDFSRNNKVQGYLFAIEELLVRFHLRKSTQIDDEVVPEKVRVVIFALVDSILQCSRPAGIKYVQILDLIFEKGYHYIGVPEDLVNKLGNYFIRENELDTLDGAKQLLLSRLSTLLYKVYAKKSDDLDELTDLIQLGLYSPLYECQLSAIKFIADHIDIFSDEARSDFIKIMWFILKSDSWTHVKARSLFLLKELLIANSFEGDLSLESKVEILFDLVKDPSEDVQATSLECCGPFIAQLSKGDRADFFDKWFQFVESYGRDESSFHLRMGSLSSCKSYLQVSGKDENNQQRYLRVLIKVYQFLYDDDEEIRDSASSFLSQEIMGLQFNLVSVELQKKLLGFFKRSFDQLLINEEIFKVYVKILTDLNLEIIDQSFLFNVEKDNFYKNIVDEYEFYISMLDLQNEPAKREIIQSIVSEKTDKVKELLALEDNVLGIFRNEEYFNFIYVLLLNLKGFQLDSTIPQLLGAKSGLHPVLKEFI